MPITRKDILAHLESSAKVGFLQAGDQYQPMRSKFCGEVDSDGAYEIYADMQAPPMPYLHSGKQGAGGVDGRTGAYKQGDFGGPNTIQILDGAERALIVDNLDWRIPIGITFNAINDARVGSLTRWAENARVNFEKHMDKIAFQALNEGAVTTGILGPIYDGKALFADDHADPGALYSTGQDNKYTSALSITNYDTIRIAGRGFRDSQGEPAGRNHSLLVFASELYATAKQIAANELLPHVSGTGTADQVNPWFGMTDLTWAPGGYLDSTAWFVVDNQGGYPLYLQMRERPNLVTWADENAEIQFFKWRARYNIFAGDWRRVIQGNS